MARSKQTRKKRSKAKFAGVCLSGEALRMVDEIQKAEHRPSRRNTVEYLIRLGYQIACHPVYGRKP